MSRNKRGTESGPTAEDCPAWRFALVRRLEGHDGSGVESQDWVQLLKALADETRLRIVGLLLNEPLTVRELATRLEATDYNVSRHLRVLREAGVVISDKQGRWLRSAISPAFRRRLSGNETVLDLGCCRFRFDHLPTEQVSRGSGTG